MTDFCFNVKSIYLNWWDTSLIFFTFCFCNTQRSCDEGHDSWMIWVRNLIKYEYALWCYRRNSSRVDPLTGPEWKQCRSLCTPASSKRHMRKKRSWLEMNICLICCFRTGGSTRSLTENTSHHLTTVIKHSNLHSHTRDQHRSSRHWSPMTLKSKDDEKTEKKWRLKSHDVY